MDEASKEDPNVIIFLGRTVEGFNKFLTEKNLNVIEPEILADYIRKSIINFEKDDIVASNRLINEIWDIVGIKDPDISMDVARQFGKLCDTYRSVIQYVTGEVNVSEKLKRDV